MKLLAIALGFLTILPVRTTDYETGDIGRAAVYFPFVGLAIGVIVGFVHVLLQNFISVPMNAMLSLLLWTGLSGFLHLDGFLHMVNALFHNGSPAERLKVLKEAAPGNHAVILLVLYFLLKITAFEALPAGAELGIFLISYASVMGHWSMVFVAQINPPAKAEGLGAEFKSGFQASTGWTSLLLPVAMTILGSYFFGLHILVAGVVVVLFSWGISRSACQLLGGFTGDLLGMMLEISELLCLLIFAIR